MQDESIDLEAVMRRVGKLLAIANDARANPAEAAAAASQAEKIMRKFQIEHADVIGAALKRDDSFDEREVGGTMNPEALAKSTTAWAGQLALAIGKLNDCKTAWARSRPLGVCLRFSGYKSDTKVAVWTYLYIVNAMAMALRQYQREAGADRGASGSFRSGYVSACVESLKQALEDKRAEMSHGVSSRALVVCKANAVTERFGKQRERTTRGSVHDGGAFFRGVAEGKKLDIGRRGVAGGTSSAARIS